MRISDSRWIPVVALALAGTVMTGCAQLGTIGQVLDAVLTQPGQQAGEAVVQLQGIDTRQQALQVQTQDGQRGAVHYDQRTRVFDEQGNEGRLENLRRGDILAMRIHQADRGYYTDMVQRRNDLAQAPGGAQQMQQVSGHVTSVDRQNRRFQMRTLHGPTITVRLSDQVGAADRDRFERLETGAYITAAGQATGDTEFLLHQFVTQ